MFEMMFAMVSGLVGLVFTALGLLILAPIVALWFWVLVRVLNKAGFSGWWSLLSLFPPALVVGVWILAFTDWPRDRDGVTLRIEVIPPR